MKLSESRPSQPTGAAFLLAQLGAHGADRFGERTRKLGLAPRHAGILRLIGRTPSCNQRELAKRLGVLPSRMVVLIDELADKGLVERRRSKRDRRHYELVLTKKGQRMLENLSRVAAEHEADLLAALSKKEREYLAVLGRKIAEHQGLTADVHPGYRTLGKSRRGGC
jgi:DNA-binding MarR family transcriptional regulator